MSWNSTSGAGATSSLMSIRIRTTSSTSWSSSIAGPPEPLRGGDEDQGIFGFRGADIRNILEFERDYPDARVLKLERNYRSTKTILAAANSVIANNLGRKEKTLWTDNHRGEPIVLFQGQDERAEAAFVVGEVERLWAEGRPLSSCSILYRPTPSPP